MTQYYQVTDSPLAEVIVIRICGKYDELYGNERKYSTHVELFAAEIVTACYIVTFEVFRAKRPSSCANVKKVVEFLKR